MIRYVEMTNDRINEENNIKKANELKNKIEKESLKFYVKAGNDGKTFGSVSSKQICEKLAELGYKVDKKGIMINESLSSIGTFYVDTVLYKKVIAKVKVEIIKK